MKLIAMWEALDVNSYRFDPYIGLVCRAGARGFTVSHCLGRSRRRPTEESQTHLRVATQVFVGGLRASTFDAKSTCPCDLAVMLNVATVSDKPPGVEARAATGGALLLAMATLEPLGAEPLGYSSAAALLQLLSSLTVKVILAICMWASAAKPQRQYLQP